MKKQAWLQSIEAQREFGFSRSDLPRWKQRCGPLGRPIKTRAYGPKGKLFKYSRADLEKLAALPLLENGVLVDAMGEWLSAAEMKRQYGDAQRLAAWRKRCPVLGRAIKAKQVWVRLPAGGFHRLWVYLASDLELAVAKHRDAPAESIEGDWGTASEAEKRVGFHAQTIRRWHREGRSPDGKPLRSRIELRHNGLYARETTVFFIPQLEDIKARMVPPADDAVWIPIGPAIKRLCISRGVFQQRCGKANWPGFGPFRASKRTAAKADGRQIRADMWHIHKDDLEAIEQARKPKTGEGDGKWLRFEAAATRYSVSKGTISRWVNRGCVWLGGAKMRMKRNRTRTAQGYFQVPEASVEDLEKAHRAKHGIEEPKRDPPKEGTAERRRGRPKKTERNLAIKKRAREKKLTDKPTELKNLLNSDSDFVGQFETVSLDAVKKVLRTMKKRC